MMIGLDTNILVRYITQDDVAQSPKANALIESFSSEHPGFIALAVVLELVWVLEGCYDCNKEDVLSVLGALLRTRGLVVENADIVWRALQRFTDANADFSDCLIDCSNHSAGCIYTATFDRNAAKTAGMQILN